MRVDVVLRLSHHLTLALASLCLIVVLDPFVPDFHAYLWPVPILFLGVAFLREGWSLPNGAANVIGVAAIFLGLRWFWYNFKALYQHIAFPAILVPYAAVILMILTVLITVRARSPRDFWHLQGLGLVQVAVACTLAGPPMFALFLFAYLASVLACLAVHDHVGQSRTMAAADTTGSQDRLPFRPLSRTTLGWAAAVTATTIFLTWLTPRPSTVVWDPLAQFGVRPRAVQAEVGFDEEIDLSHTGSVELNDAVAFTVEVTDAQGGPKDDLSSDQRWRGGVLDIYEKGKWRSMQRSGVIGPISKRRSVSSNLPDLGPKQFFFSYRVPVQQAGGLFLAEPVRLGPHTELPVISDNADARQEQFFEPFMGTVLPLPNISRADCRYTQVSAPVADPERVPMAQPLRTFYLSSLKANYLPELQAWTHQLLIERLLPESGYGLTQADLDLERIRVNNGWEVIPAAADKVARALCNYLAGSGDFQYSLDLHREDPNVDPVLDFLQNVKQGHCERFAAGLALMLRSQGIPARLVKGFRGLERQEAGKFLVRQRHAHTWVEALVHCPQTEDSASYEWLVLDPTPIFEARQLQGPSLLSIALERIKNYDLLWKDFAVDYGRESQLRLFQGLLSWRFLLGMTCVLGTMWVVRRRRRRTSTPRATLPGFARLVALLTRHGGPVPQPTQTPREYAAAAGSFLRSTTAAPLADFPAEVARLLYRARYAGQPLSQEERQAVNSHLDQLASLLKNSSRA